MYLGEHIGIGKKVAVKFLHAELAQKEEMVQRFSREARAAAAIGHKNIIDVIDVGASQYGEPYMVMEYLKGESLSSTLVRTGPIDLAAACGVLEQTLLALAAAHEKGIVHRDLKPDNILLVPQPREARMVKLIDFVISKFIDESDNANLTRDGSLLGTPSYMSSEQARNASGVDHRADLYSVGVILYEMLTGKHPFEGAHENELLINVLTADPKPPKKAYSDFLTEAEPILMQTLSKDPGVRPQSAIEMLDAIKQLSVFDKRHQRLIHLISGIENNDKKEEDSGKRGSKTHLIDPAQSPFGQDHSVYDVASGGWRRGVYWGIAGAAAALVVGLAIFYLIIDRFSFRQEAKVTASDMGSIISVGRDQNRVETVKDNVRIEVRGAPRGAKVFWGEAPVPMNPFRVDRKDTIALVKVEAEGFEPFITSLVPSKDQLVEVKMKPKEEELIYRFSKKEQIITVKKDTRPLGAGPVGKPGYKKKSKFRKDKHGIKFGDRFE